MLLEVKETEGRKDCNLQVNIKCRLKLGYQSGRFNVPWTGSENTEGIHLIHLLPNYSDMVGFHVGSQDFIKCSAAIWKLLRSV